MVIVYQFPFQCYHVFEFKLYFTSYNIVKDRLLVQRSVSVDLQCEETEVPREQPLAVLDTVN